MNKSEAAKLLERLAGRSINGLTLSKAIGTGATAAVYSARSDTGELRAVKIYDPQFADSERLERELRLKDHDCAHLVKVFDGGVQRVDDIDVLFLTMEFVDGPELTRMRDRRTPTPDSELRLLLAQLCEACGYLLDRALCHRDVKTQNIKTRSNGELVLLDMGVLRPGGDSDLTSEGRNVATRRYSPPELQHRIEQPDAEGFEAITVYQIGAVFFELIQRTRLFANVPDHPDATLSRAVDTELPRFIGATAGADFCEIVLKCLAKDWKARPRLSELREIAEFRPSVAVSHVGARRQMGRQAAAEIRALEQAAEVHLNTLSEQVLKAADVVTTAFAALDLPAPAFERVAFSKNGGMLVATFAPSIDDGFPCVLHVAMRVTSRPSDSAILIAGCAMYGSSFMPTAKQVPMVFRFREPRGPIDTSMSRMFESVWALPLDEETLSRRTESWLRSIVERYFASTGTYFEALVQYRKDAANAKMTGQHVAHISSLPASIFNTQDHNELPPRNWDR